MTRRAWLATLAAALAGGRAWAHHSFAAEFDGAKPRALTGTVVQFDWVNPHAVLWIDVADGQGGAERWALELPPPNALRRRGLMPAEVTPGQRVVVKAFVARDGRRRASTQWVELPGGRRISTGTPGSSR